MLLEAGARLGGELRRPGPQLERANHFTPQPDGLGAGPRGVVLRSDVGDVELSLEAQIGHDPRVPTTSPRTSHRFCACASGLAHDVRALVPYEEAPAGRQRLATIERCSPWNHYLEPAPS